MVCLVSLCYGDFFGMIWLLYGDFTPKRRVVTLPASASGIEVRFPWALRFYVLRLGVTRARVVDVVWSWMSLETTSDATAPDRYTLIGLTRNIYIPSNRHIAVVG